MQEQAVTLIPATMLQSLAITNAAAVGEIALAIAIDQIEPDGEGRMGVPRPAMRSIPTPTLLEGELEDLIGLGTLEANDASFTITFARKTATDAAMAWIVVEGIALHTPHAGRIPFAPILCRLRRRRR
jgi:hypothetical protein